MKFVSKIINLKNLGVKFVVFTENFENILG